MTYKAAGTGEAGGSAAPNLLTRGGKGAVLPLAFHWDSNKVKRLLCSIEKVSVVSVFRFHFLQLFQH